MKRSTIQLIPDDLYRLYYEEKRSVAQIAELYICSQNKISYWLDKFEIPKRTISEAVYILKNPLGDPFDLIYPTNKEEAILYGMGLGLYWGEGQKRGNGGLRLTNSDPKLIKKFIEFLEKFLLIDKGRIKFSLLIFIDINKNKALNYWIKELGVKKSQFYKPQIIKVRGEGTYKNKSKFGTVIVYFNNTKLKKTICTLIENIQ